MCFFCLSAALNEELKMKLGRRGVSQEWLIHEEASRHSILNLPSQTPSRRSYLFILCLLDERQGSTITPIFPYRETKCSEIHSSQLVGLRSLKGLWIVVIKRHITLPICWSWENNLLVLLSVHIKPFTYWLHTSETWQSNYVFKINTGS